MSEEKKKPDQAELAPFLHDVAQEKNGKPVEKHKRDKETSCGFWIFKSDFLQRFATEKMYVLIYGVGGCLLSMSLAYFSGTITMLEKRYKIPTQVSGIILVGNDMSMMITSVLGGYYIHRGHRPRWIGCGFFTIFIFCMLTSSLHFMYGPGEDALKLTREYADSRNISGLLTNATTSRTDQKLCMANESSCIKEAGIWIPQAVLFLGQFISGIGIGLFWTVGVSYMDDNTSKAKSPALLSATAFLRMLGPAIGYSLASMCLRFYVDPSLHPLIKPGDPRWLGAWWMGWLIIGGITFLISFLMCLFPAELPSAKARRLKLEQSGKQDPSDHKDLSVSDMWRSVKRLAGNKVFMYNTFAQSFYLFGYLAYWIYTPKYIETQYRQSASTATLATGSVALGFSAAGVVLSGYVVSKFKPKARTMAAWNALVDFLTVAGCLCYIIIACKGSDQLGSMATTSECSASCHCEYVHYAPVCTPNNVTFISACHAGCTGKIKDPLGHNIYTGCSCIHPSNSSTEAIADLQHAVDGACPVDCTNQFLVFLVVMCILKFIGASSKSTSVLITLRCILPEDKSLAMGITGLAASVMALIPSPIFFGWLLDKYCLVWGKTCSNKGNCWLYDTESLRYAFNLISAVFIFVGGLLNIRVWLNSKDLKIFDEEHYEEKDKKTKSKSTELIEIVKEPKESQGA